MLKTTELKEPCADLVYEIVKTETREFDSIYKDYILELVGTFGLNALLTHKLIETCGVINGRPLFVLVDKK